MKTSLPVEKRFKKTGKVIERMKPTLERFDNSNHEAMQDVKNNIMHIEEDVILRG